ncbi:ABC transporter ATP-binding protein [Paludibacterium paludis]|uniref:ABC transporter n=1 Tax=Paludibacterium paludis TaxID=1225769 RepID=A0A918P373_9NEIS|nr:ABC transporter ATP-binding protein [Paludibacterium paludis]GGY17607.1 ABC transporter [Paludibacterium paludis]
MDIPSVASALRIAGLKLAYPQDDGQRLTVLDIDELTLGQGEHVALLGPSGCGKTTLLHVLCGITRADAGTVSWFGEPLEGWTESRTDRWRWRNVGLVFQQFHLFGGLSALDNVMLPTTFGRCPDKSALREHALMLLEEVGVRAGQRADSLSRGQMQRVAMARALLFRPPVVLADEPTASLDQVHAAKAMNLLARLCRDNGSTLIAATHDPLLASLMTRRLSLSGGRLIP